MRRIVYLSRATTRMTSQAVEQLCSQAQAKNAQSGVTGLLLSDGARFIQAIEGKKEEVANTMARIKNDIRHADISKFEDVRIGHREFGNWSMLCRFLIANEDVNNFQSEVFELTATVSNPYVRASFIGFVKMSL